MELFHEFFMVPRHASLTMRLPRPVLAAILVSFASPCFAESSTALAVNNPPAQQNSFVDLLALMSGTARR